MSDVKKTPFYDKHVLLHAKVVDFAGYKMPMFYEGIVPEHINIRQNAGLFDISHMGEFYVSGEGALNFIQSMTTNDVSRIPVWGAQYSAMLYENGGIVDDLLIYRFPDKFMLVVNASNLEKDWNWLMAHKPANVSMIDVSDATGLLALQGPRAQKILNKLVNYDLDKIKYYHFAELPVAGRPMVVARTGYTGEDGFELYMSASYGFILWDEIMQAGESEGIKPTGLGARDSLRLEMKYALYGNDMDERTNPLEAGLQWIVKLDKGNFMGRDAIIEAKTRGLERKLVCFELVERGFPRHGYVVAKDGQEIGVVTSGTFSPSLEKGIGLAYVPNEFSKPGATFDIPIRGTNFAAVVVKPPFWTKGTVRVND